MRQIDEQTRDAFIAKKRFKLKNTKIDIIDGEPHLYLHGYLIAKIEDGNLLINHCGWETRTTSSRLNSLPGVQIKMIKGKFRLNEMGYMNNEWININRL